MKNQKIIYNGFNVTIKEDEENYYIDFNEGLGEGIYQKKKWGLEDALYDQEHVYNENR